MKEEKNRDTPPSAASGNRMEASRFQDPETRIQTPGLYIHVPFCLRKCRYCDFASTEDLSLQGAYAEAVCREMEMVAESFPPFDTLYIGGGTPTAVTGPHLSRIVESARTAFSFTASPEVTVEANPGTLSSGLLDRLQEAGVNRLNIGVQSFSDGNLRFLGRIHSAKAAENSIALARRAGFENIGIDLIYGLPGQGRDAWREDLERALAFSPEHLSCYMLTFEPGTLLSRDLAAGRIAPPEEEAVAELFALTADTLCAGGYLHYEVSNFARAPRFCSRHNRKYWALAPTLGLGPSAHSYLPAPPARWWNHRRLDDYLQALGAGQRPVQEKEALDQRQCMTEAVFLCLRTAGGIDPEGFSRRFGVSFDALFGDLVRELEAEGMLSRVDSRWAPTRRGMQFADGVAGRLIERI